MFILFTKLTRNSSGFSEVSTNLKISLMAFTIRPSPVLLESLPEDEGVAVEGVAAFLGLGPSIVCVLNEVENSFISLINRFV